MVNIYELWLYALAMVGLWLVPGPVWLALIARTITGGFAGAWPLAVGVALGDLIWPLAAILGLGWIGSGQYGQYLEWLGWLAAGVFMFMGVRLLLAPAPDLHGESRLTQGGKWAGFAVGLAAIIGNPKAILFYMGVLPGFFDLSRLNMAMIIWIMIISAFVPMMGNLMLSLAFEKVRLLLAQPRYVQMLYKLSGGIFILVGLMIMLL